ncbi:hypothetical protein G5B47_10390 [Paenibacillus sp. 7124]|uniref:Uncharacterized protein n=1 Tax=Paenibacillus apii TaxID=1850370 RepID=A0A6M1PRE9_9BACL|nr:hypothetical protein [Paenibacillus apii]NGM82821.1 hypothetical protein [Paenibacillus apii]NJJ39961.1 hypothetical protein [Paenibacillus apii]
MKKPMDMNTRAGQAEMEGKTQHGVASKVKAFLADERGAVGVKEIAVTVAVIVIIGAVVSLITDSFLNTWISEVWEFFMTQIEKMTT